MVPQLDPRTAKLLLAYIVQIGTDVSILEALWLPVY